MTLYWTARASENLSGILSYIAKDSEQSAATVKRGAVEIVSGETIRLEHVRITLGGRKA